MIAYALGMRQSGDLPNWLVREKFLTRSPRQVVTAGDIAMSGLLGVPEGVAPGAPLLVAIHGSGCHGGYFDLPNNSLLEAAVARGLPVLLVDRPGHGASPTALSGSAIDGSVDAVALLIDEVQRATADARGRRVSVLGHSFGAAVAITYAARAKNVASLCISGIGDVPNPAYSDDLRTRSAGGGTRPSPQWFFGPSSTYETKHILALRAVAAPWRKDEVDELNQSWPVRWPQAAAAITCPVHLRIAEFERIWQATPDDVKRMASAFHSAPFVDAAIAPDGGHLYEAHRRGPELIAAQLDFVMARATET